MQLPFHPSISHIPIVLSFIMPILVIVFAYLIKNNKLTPKGWLIVIGLQLVITISGYVGLETGGREEQAVAKVLSKNLIHAHEEAAEVFVGTTVIILVLSVAVFFIRKELQFYIELTIAVLSLVACYLGYETGRLGGELVYKHGAASVYSGHSRSDTEGLLPTPGMHTSESPMPADDNESLKADDNDYGNEGVDSDDDDSKQED